MKTTLFALLFLTFATAIASAQINPNECQACNSNAQCFNTNTGGCGCERGYDPAKRGIRCAYCGFCVAGGCLVPCGHNSAPQAATVQPSWVGDAALSPKVNSYSPTMAFALETAQDATRKGMCAMLRGTLKMDSGQKVSWSSVQTPTGGVTILTSSEGHTEQLFIESRGWGLVRDNENVAGEVKP